MNSARLERCIVAERHVKRNGMALSEKQRVALISLIASAVLAGSKLYAGFATGSLGILSEAIHSVLDFGATIITFLAVKWSDQPPDAEHHYGHAKAESVAALAETGLLFLTTVWIVYEAAHRIISGETHVVTWLCTFVITSTSLRGPTAQPMRKPVMPYSFATPLTTITLLFSKSLSVKRYPGVGCLPSKTSLW
jgi:predicted Co/Zn/Cd cation transporter (cation efflux family)